MNFPRLASAVLAAGCLAVCPLSAQEPGPDLATLYNTGIQAFGTGDWAGSITALEALLARAEITPQIEPAYFTLGAAYFNAQQFDKAISAFRNYQEKFPKGVQVDRSRFALANAHIGAKQYDAARAIFVQLETVPAFREASLLAQADVATAAGDPEKGIAPLERLTAAGLLTPASVKGALTLASLYASTGESDKALGVLKQLQAQIDRVDNVVLLNNVALKIGDDFFKSSEYESAIEVYRSIRFRDELIAFQNQRIARMDKELAAVQASLRAQPKNAPEFIAQMADLRSGSAEARALLEAFQKLPDFAPGLYLRMGRSFYESGRRWESIVVNRTILESYPSSPEAAPARFSEAVCFADLERYPSALRACELYLAADPRGPFAANASFLRASIALQLENLDAAEKYFDEFLNNYKDSTYRESARFSLAQVLFGRGRYDEAIVAFGSFLNEFPNSSSAEDAEYRLALASMFSGNVEQAVGKMNFYLEKHPEGRYRADARYRLAVCDFGASAHDRVLVATAAWETDYPGNEQLTEVLSLRGDALAALERPDDALASYRKAAATGESDEVTGYALGEATKILRKRGDWAAISVLYEEYVKTHPDGSLVPTAVYWIGRAKATSGSTAEAMAFVAETTRKHLADPSREAIEQLLSQLAQMAAREARRNQTPAADAEKAIKNLLVGPSSTIPENPTAQARVWFAKQELATAMRQNERAAEIRKLIATDFQPEILSPVLLGQCGDYLLEQGDASKAATIYAFLRKTYPKSAVVDFAYAGEARMAFERGDFEKTLKLTTDGTERIAAARKLKDLTLLKGRALLELGRLDEAAKIFEQVASVREWRGEATAASVFFLGEVERRRGDWSKAISYYQRVYVAYQKFLPWVSKAYLQSALAFEKLGKLAEAANTYRELLRNERLGSMPEIPEARKRLEQLAIK